ncbi:hypothetical protein [Chryseobacterium taichungense]|uniref:hypothetical protein n=1 Tax=Chryseobacterium taichungense TaxID=295069 RepID=UPI0028AF4816|nr:hypothetical protein [Chryseobacterium taichungense]
MKLLLITAVEEFEKDIINILTHSGVKAFSYQSVEGYRNSENNIERWFSTQPLSVDSLLFTVFVEDGFVDEIYTKIETLNSGLEILSQIHMASISLEKSL